MKISKKTREQAAIICAACACSSEPISVTSAVAARYGVDVPDAVRMPVALVAVRAWAHANDNHGHRLSEAFGRSELRDDYAEAEALLRTGWSPS